MMQTKTNKKLYNEKTNKKIPTKIFLPGGTDTQEETNLNKNSFNNNLMVTLVVRTLTQCSSCSLDPSKLSNTWISQSTAVGRGKRECTLHMAMQHVTRSRPKDTSRLLHTTEEIS